MSEKKYPIITISREYCAGGRSIARGLEEKLGIPFYDRDFVKKTSEASGYSEEDIRKDGEQVNRAERIVTNLLNPVTYESASDGIYKAQKKVIMELSKEPCIIIGRCSNVILKEAGVPVFRIFLYSDLDHRLKRAAEIAENGNMDLKKYLAKRDDRRAYYYKTYTGHPFGDYHDYDISLNTGSLGYEKCVDILADAIRSISE